jgi:hypothetical protein
MLERGLTPPHGVFKGRNIMTPEWVEGGRVRPGVWYEVSRGRGIEGEPIFGVTIRADDGQNVVSCPSKLVYSRKQALDYLQELADPDHV